MPICISLQGMDIIERMDRVEFRDYLKKHQNTICGKHPIGILLSVSIRLSQLFVVVYRCTLQCTIIWVVGMGELGNMQGLVH